MFLLGNLRELSPNSSDIIHSKRSHRIQAKAFRVLDKILPNNTEFRRGHVYPRIFGLAGPSEYIDTTGNGLETLNAMMEQDYPVLVIHSHVSQRDTFEPPRHWFRKVPMMRKVPLRYAIARHQMDERTEIVSGLFRTDLSGVVTKHSVENNPSLREGDGASRFILSALRTFYPSQKERETGVRPGVVVVASTPWRQDFLGEPVIRTVEQFGKVILEQEARNREKEGLLSQLRQGVLAHEQQIRLFELQRPQKYPDKLAVVFIGISIKGVRLYQQQLTGGWNRGNTYRNMMSKVYKIEDLIAQAETAGKRVDDYGFDILRDLVDAKYGDPKARDKARMQLAAERDEGITVFDPLIDFFKSPGQFFPRFSL